METYPKPKCSKTTRLTRVLGPVTTIVITAPGYDSNVHLDHPLLPVSWVVDDHVLPVSDSLLQRLLLLLHPVWIVLKRASRYVLITFSF